MNKIILILVLTQFSAWDSSVTKVETKTVGEFSKMEDCQKTADIFNTDMNHNRNMKAICAEKAEEVLMQFGTSKIGGM